MAMEKHYEMNVIHKKKVTAVGYNMFRDQLVLGCEDGLMQTWDPECGKFVSSFHEHKGWITCFANWIGAKLFFSTGIDGYIIVWHQSGVVTDRIKIDRPIYAMVICSAKKLLICGFNSAIQIYSLDEDRKTSLHLIVMPASFVSTHHTGLVRCVLCTDNKIISAGYDGKLIIYDSPFTADTELQVAYRNDSAHTAGISCMIYINDNDVDTWIITGSFDQTVKVWNADGSLVHKLSGFHSSVTGICYVPNNKTLWIAGGYSYAYLYDPRSGDKVSDFLDTFHNHHSKSYILQMVHYIPELNEVIGLTSRRQVIAWHYVTSGCLTTLKCEMGVECLAYSRKDPILLFSGHGDGNISQWERLESNHFKYTFDNFLMLDTEKCENIAENFNVENNSEEQDVHKNSNKYKKYMKTCSILSIEFVEELDVLVAACEDGNLYVWGFDQDAIKDIENMPGDIDSDNEYILKALIPDSQLLKRKHEAGYSEDDIVTNRVAGFICRYIFKGHTSQVTSFIVSKRIHNNQGTYVVSGGWDQMLYIWDLEKGELQDVYRNSISSPKSGDLACDGMILDMAFSPSYNEFAYTSDETIFVRTFSPNGHEMTLIHTLQGHSREISCIRWNPVMNYWVSSSLDNSIRVWINGKCDQTLWIEGEILTLCIDEKNGAIITAVQEGDQFFMKVHDPVEFRLVQVNEGHADTIVKIIHLKERDQYITASWDKTIGIWNAWMQPSKRN